MHSKKEEVVKPVELRGILCRNYPISYINVPKSACTSIKNIMYTMDTGLAYPDPLAIHADQNCLLKGRKPNPEYNEAARNVRFRFTFVREPLARCYSAFNEKIFHQGIYSFAAYRSLLAERYNAAFPKAGEPYSAQQHSDNFLRFIEMVADTESGAHDIKVNLHWQPQSKILRRWRMQKVIDLIGRVEKFEEGMTYVLSASGFKGSIDLKTRFNEGPPPPYSFKEIETAEIRQRLYDVYESDLRDFHYA